MGSIWNSNNTGSSRRRPNRDEKPGTLAKKATKAPKVQKNKKKAVK